MNNIIWGVMRGITISLTMLPITLANIRCLVDQSQAGDTGAEAILTEKDRSTA